MTQMSWGWNLHRRIAGAIEEARHLRNMSVQQLSDQTAQLGYPISRSVLTNYENGRKQSLDIAELLVLARVLEVPPLALLFPPPSSASVEVLPDVTATTLEAVSWFCADRNQHRPRIEAQAAIAQLESIISSATTAIGGQGKLSAVPQLQTKEQNGQADGTHCDSHAHRGGSS